MAAEPARLRCHDLVAQCETEQRRVTGADADLGTKAGLEIAGHFPVDQISHILLGREADHDPQPVPLRRIEKRSRRHRVRDPDGIHPERRHLGEIALDQPIVGIFAACLIRAERTISDAAHKEGFTARRKRLAVDRSPV